ncbi:cell division protein FtsQ/DivIB [Prevotella sp. FD3004]|uniref:cell division protein FtsQ/DivIB n=1 Tax=Prevotella sp. FD3004 TaxID=1408309 RepID=UPI00055BAFFE|nr:hypothetical protein [Prevotella sp. FD3004]
MTVNWKKSALVACDLVIAAYLLLAITAFNRPDVKATYCSEVKIDIEESEVEGFLNVDEIKRILSQDHLYPLSQPMQAICPRKIEESLHKSPFVEKAECHKTQSGHVCIRIQQRLPVVRVMADNGENYYVDSHGNMMPETRYVTDLIIATGHISRKYAQGILTQVAKIVLQDNFWKNQVVQINVLPNGSMEIVPRVGDHIIYLGLPNQVEKKLERMRKFYLYGLNKAGWNKYSYISVEFNNQIICKKRNSSKS